VDVGDVGCGVDEPTGVGVERLSGVGVGRPIGVADEPVLGLDVGVGSNVGWAVSRGGGVGLVVTWAVGPQATASRPTRR
jgi:hypothetical protein